MIHVRLISTAGSPVSCRLTVDALPRRATNCVALVLAFLVAPFQHVHPGADHDHSATMHAHFYRIAPAQEQHHGLRLADADDDDHDAVWSVDSFTLIPTVALTLIVPARVVASFFNPAVPLAWVEVIEERGHDPPPLADRSIPRALLPKLPQAQLEVCSALARFVAKVLFAWPVFRKESCE
jgi:hypothetical protein